MGGVNFDAHRGPILVAMPPREVKATTATQAVTNALTSRPKMTEDTDPRPYLVITVLLDSSARPAEVSRSHGDGYERALNASQGQEIAGVELVELPIAAPVFKALRQPLAVPGDAVGLYDVFPLASHLKPEFRKIAGQFLAAEALWTLEEQGLLGGVPVNVKLEVPKGWQTDPKDIHQHLVSEGALDLTESGIETYKAIKTAWDSPS
jgi:hypothetical protein